MEGFHTAATVCLSLHSHSGDGLWEKEEDLVSVTVRSFSGEIHIVKVAKRKGMEGVRLLYSEEGEGKEEDAGGMWATLSRYRLVGLQNVYIFVKLPLGFHAARPPQFLYYQSTASCTKRPGSPLNTHTCPLLYIHIVIHLTDFSASYNIVDEISIFAFPWHHEGSVPHTYVDMCG